LIYYSFIYKTYIAIHLNIYRSHCQPSFQLMFHHLM
jgi:hypothetical protein